MTLLLIEYLLRFILQLVDIRVPTEGPFKLGREEKKIFYRHKVLSSIKLLSMLKVYNDIVISLDHELFPLYVGGAIR